MGNDAIIITSIISTSRRNLVIFTSSRR